ncbi:hypothetical protein ABZP36_031619 [Zizania latifolia]
MQTAFTNKNDYGKGEREAQWATAQRTLHGLNQATTSSDLFNDKTGYRELSEIAEQAAKRAEVARYAATALLLARCTPLIPLICNSLLASCFSYGRLRELHTLKGRVESVVKLKGLDIDTIQQSYTV